MREHFEADECRGGVRARASRVVNLAEHGCIVFRWRLANARVGEGVYGAVWEVLLPRPMWRDVHVRTASSTHESCSIPGAESSVSGDHEPIVDEDGLTRGQSGAFAR